MPADTREQISDPLKNGHVRKIFFPFPVHGGVNEGGFWYLTEVTTLQNRVPGEINVKTS